jgi:hypothetical protein
MRRFLATFCLLLSCTVSMTAQVPQMINYQGRVAVGNVNFTGTGQFKFALVSAGGAQTYWSNDGTSVAGSEPVAAVSRPVVSGLYDVLLGDTGLTNMTAVPPAVFNNVSVWLRVWFNDGVNGSEMLTPDTRIAAVGYAMVAEGVKPGGVTSGMIAPGAVTGAHIANGAITAANIAPGVLTGGGGGSVPAGSITLSADPNSASLAAAGYSRISKTNLAQEAWSAAVPGEFSIGTLANAIWTGTEMLVWQDGWGFVMRYDPAIDQWTRGSSAGAPIPAVPVHTQHIAWSGTELYVIGPGSFAKYQPGSDSWATLSIAGAPGGGDVYYVAWTGDRFLAIGDSVGGIYDPTSNTWQAISMVGAPTRNTLKEGARVWTGTELVAWGNGSSSAGARYNPVTNTWTAMSSSVMSGRIYPHCCWTGTHVLIYGGNANGPGDGGGALYHPATDSWTSINTTGEAWSGGLRTNASSNATIWTGTEMIVWGGSDGLDNSLNNGARYNPATDTWSPIPAVSGVAGRSGQVSVWTGTEMIMTGARVARYTPSTSTWIPDRPSSLEPSNRSSHSSAWTGSEMIAWGGVGSGGVLGTGGRYHPQTGERRPLPMSGAPYARSGHSCAWSGSEMIVWGGADGATHQADGARYQPGANVWIAMSGTSAPSARKDHSAVWTGTEYVVWGGIGSGGLMGDGARYSPAGDAWTAVNATGAPSARRFHTAVWTGTEMIVWGGIDSALTPLGDGARYDPATDTWTPVSTSGAPAARYVHSAIWTGSEMIVWGGNTPGATSTGARYTPATDTWVALPGTSAPSARSGHSAVWTGTEMIVWGGASGGAPVNSGGRFNPTVGLWEPISTASAPAARTQHTAVWAQGSMLVFGGTDSSYAPLSDIAAYVPPQTVFVYQHP